MRTLLVLCILLIAGCAQPIAGIPEAGGEGPLFGELGTRAVYQFGNATEGEPDARVLVGECSREGQVNAFKLDMRRDGKVRPSQGIMAPYGGPDVERFLVAAFVPSPDGLVLAKRYWGGSAVEIEPAHAHLYPNFRTSMIDSLMVPLGDDGFMRLVIACQGERHANYVIGSWGLGDVPTRPVYIDGIERQGFGAMLAHGSGRLDMNTAGFRSTWSTVGDIKTTYTGDDVEGAHVGVTELSWASSPGWAHVRCGHEGMADHGEWSIQSTLGGGWSDRGALVQHGYARNALGPWNPLSIEVAGDSTSPGFTFRIDHAASMDGFWQTACAGEYLRASLEQLFGQPAAPVAVVEGRT